MTSIYLSHSPEALDLYFGSAALEKIGHLGHVGYPEPGVALDQFGFAAQAYEADLIVAHRVPAVPAELIGRLTRARAICRVAMDIRNIDVRAASRNGILVTHASAGFAVSVSEWIVGVMIDHARHISQSVCLYRAGREPEAHMGRELRNAELGVIGYGVIGQSLVRLALAFGMKVRVHDPYRQVSEAGVVQEDLCGVLKKSDYVVCLAPAMPGTRGLMGVAEFALMRSSAFFVNASRGELVDEGALLDALNGDSIAGCGMDVGLGGDQKPSRSLARHPKVIATPHIAGLTVPAVEHQAMDVVDQVAAILKGEKPAGAVNWLDAGRLHSGSC